MVRSISCADRSREPLCPHRALCRDLSLMVQSAPPGRFYPASGSCVNQKGLLHAQVRGILSRADERFRLDRYGKRTFDAAPGPAQTVPGRYGMRAMPSGTRPAMTAGSFGSSFSRVFFSTSLLGLTCCGQSAPHAPPVSSGRPRTCTRTVPPVPSQS